MGYERYDGETDDELIFRITGDKELIGSWQDVADILNSLLGTNYAESKFRKQRQSFDSVFEANETKFGCSKNVLDEIRAEREALEKANVQYRDERNEYRRVIREEARKESYMDLIRRTIVEHAPVKMAKLSLDEKPSGSNDLVVHLTELPQKQFRRKHMHI